MLRMNLSMSDCRGQCYHGAANMCVSKNLAVPQISCLHHVAYLFIVIAMITTWPLETCSRETKYFVKLLTPHMKFQNCYSFPRGEMLFLGNYWQI